MKYKEISTFVLLVDYPILIQYHQSTNMFLFKYKHIKQTEINNLKSKLLNFAHITEQDIRDVWRKPNEELVNDFSKIVYNYSVPLYQKMIFRFRNENKSAPMLYKGCDPGNQRQLMTYFGLYSFDDISNVIEFMAWIKYSCYTSREYVNENVWKSTGEIDLYFMLNEDQQTNLINEYNKDIVDKFNSDISKIKIDL